MPALCWFVATLSPWQLMVSKSPCVDAQRIHMIIAGIVVRRVSKWLQKWWQNWHRICFGTATGSIQVPFALLVARRQATPWTKAPVSDDEEEVEKEEARIVREPEIYGLCSSHCRSTRVFSM